MSHFLSHVSTSKLKIEFLINWQMFLRANQMLVKKKIGREIAWVLLTGFVHASTLVFSERSQDHAIQYFLADITIAAQIFSHFWYHILLRVLNKCVRFFVSVCMYLSVYRYINMSVCLYVCMYVFCIFVCRYGCAPMYFWVCVSLCLCLCFVLSIVTVSSCLLSLFLCWYPSLYLCIQWILFTKWFKKKGE